MGQWSIIYIHAYPVQISSNVSLTPGFTFEQDFQLISSLHYISWIHGFANLVEVLTIATYTWSHFGDFSTSVYETIIIRVCRNRTITQFIGMSLSISVNISQCLPGPYTIVFWIPHMYREERCYIKHLLRNTLHQCSDVTLFDVDVVISRFLSI